ncbi:MULTISPECIES: thioredoxin family protein [Butyricimonas]|uniref:thioredoxin family protein n=1 Tax=Butyricimonas TaxID=574697 RepID=UPI001D090484|nr:MULTISPECIES: thioredoxin family protein [Butyricimonas]MCB6973871.1 thioredoxin family protein [Butyricimonas synergistica]MCG4520786.1 thioredoxin family protein [Butyricimonas sp. DFI.6.44]
MKKLLLVFVGLLCSVVIFAQTNFQELSLEKACEQAKTENKPVFLDCYTSWCGPCKMMANNVFTLEAAGEYFNKNFVCVKIDMEKGEGPAIGKQYGVDAYPTFLIINADGKLMHKLVGAMSLEELIENVECGLKASSIAEYETLYQSGKLDKTEQMAYWKLLSISGEVVKAQTVGDDLWGKLSEKDKLNPTYWALLRSRATTIEGEEMKFVCANREYFEKEVGKEEVGKLIYNSFITELNMMIIYQLPAKKYEKVPAIKDLLKNNDVPRKEALLKITELAEARGNYDERAYLDILDANLDVWDDSEKRTIFEAAKLFISLANGKEHTRMLGDIALRAQETVKDEVVKEGIIKIGLTSRRVSGKDGVYWEDLASLKEVMERALLESRYVFLYFHNDGQTSKLINEKLFSSKEVGDYLNKFFINYKIHVGEGEGARIARKYGVIVPNVVVMIDKYGDVRHRVSNLMQGDFIERMSETFDDNKAVGELETRYAMGERSPEFMVKYLMALAKISSPRTSLVAVELFALLDDEQRVSPEFWMLYHPQFSMISSDMKNYLFSNIQEFREKSGVEKVDELVAYQINSDLNQVLYNAKARTTAEDIDRTIQFIKQNKLQNSGQLIGLANIVKLFKNKVCSVKEYKKASKGMKPEEIPFADLYANVLAMEPGRTEEWNAWGKEIVDSLTDPKYIQWYKQFLNLK